VSEETAAPLYAAVILDGSNMELTAIPLADAATEVVAVNLAVQRAYAWIADNRPRHVVTLHVVKDGVTLDRIPFEPLS
jgi:hypothetical protein